MSAVETSREAVERLRRHMGDGPVTDTLRALVSERDGAKQMAAIHEGAANALLGRIEAVQTERDAARAEVARLREALTTLEKGASYTHKLGAVTGAHWLGLGTALIKARAALAEPTP